MGFSFREFNKRLESLEVRLKKRADSISYPEWFMMPTNEGMRFLLATFLLGLASINTGNNLIYLIFGLMLSIILLSYVFMTINIKGISIAVKAPGPVYAAEASEIILKVKNDKKIGSYSIKIRLPDELNSTGQVSFVPAHEYVSIKIQVCPPGRGVFGYGSFVVESSFPFIFFRRRLKVNVEGSLIVYPSLMEVTLDSLSGIRGQGVHSQRAGEGDELISLRGFRDGDSHKSVHWKASAKAGSLLVKEYSALMPRMAMIVLDSHGPSAPEIYEKAVSYAASAVTCLIGRGYHVGLQAPGAEVPYGTGRAHMFRLLDHLAVLDEHEAWNIPPGDEQQGSVILINKTSGSVVYSPDIQPDLVVFAETL